jgi:peptidoglycan/LPS O-acetylase OafA/YrhL
MNLTYRPEVNGLRAIAVVSVILYHAHISISGVPFFQGGFLGVDIFFVISGYLITLLILKELQVTGRFSFAYFYERRARRIFPALYVVMLVSIFFANHILLQGSFKEYQASIYSAIGFISNIFFYREELEYFAQSGLLKPFLHTWSLGVEEQYYILFPIVVIFTFHYAKKYLLHVILLMLILSLVAAEYASHYQQSMAFYLLPFRMWELLAGSLLAYVEIKHGRNTAPLFQKSMPLLGLLLLVGGIQFYPDTITHPSVRTFPIIIGTMLVIYFSQGRDIASRLLASRPFVGIGLISYSLYLWHFPVFAFLRINQYNLHDKTIVSVALALIFVAAILSYYLIEQPFRNQEKVSRRRLIFFLAAMVITIIGALEYSQRYVINKTEIYAEYNPAPWNELRLSGSSTCYQKFTDPCRFGDSSNKKLFLIGDSQMATLQYDLQKKATGAGFEFIPLTSGGCFYAPNFNLVDQKSIVDNRCTAAYQHMRRELLLKNPGSFVVIGGMLSVYLSLDYFNNQMEGGYQGSYDRDFSPVSGSASFKASIKPAIEEILNTGSTVILVYPFMEPGWHLPQKLKSLLGKNPSKELVEKSFEKTYIKRSQYDARTMEAFAVFDSIQHSNIIRIYPHTVNCDETLCKTHNEDHLFYIDFVHQSDYYSKVTNDMILKAITARE